MKRLKLAESNLMLTPTEKDIILQECLYPFLAIYGCTESVLGSPELAKKKMDRYWYTWKAFKARLYFVLKSKFRDMWVGYFAEANPKEIWEFLEGDEKSEKQGHEQLIESAKEAISEADSEELEKALYSKALVLKRKIQDMFQMVKARAYLVCTEESLKNVQDNPHSLADTWKFLRGDISIAQLLVHVFGIPEQKNPEIWEDYLRASLIDFYVAGAGTGRLQLAHKQLLAENL